MTVSPCAVVSVVTSSSLGQLRNTVRWCVPYWAGHRDVAGVGKTNALKSSADTELLTAVTALWNGVIKHDKLSQQWAPMSVAQCRHAVVKTNSVANATEIKSPTEWVKQYSYYNCPSSHPYNPSSHTIMLASHWIMWHARKLYFAADKRRRWAITDLLIKRYKCCVCTYT